MKQITIPVESWSANEHQTFFRITRNNGGISDRTIVSHIGSAKTARDALTGDLIDRADRFNRVEQHTQEKTLICGDGTWLIVGWCPINDSWGYRIAGADRSYPSGSGMHSETIEDAGQRAREHAAQGYGGVISEIRTR